MAIDNGTCFSFCNQPKAHFGLPCMGTPWDNRGKCYMDGKRIQCWSNAQQHIPIYLQPFIALSDILVGNCNFFLPPCIYRHHWGVPIGIPEKYGPQKTRIMGLPGRQFDDRLSRFDTISACDGQTYRRPAYINNERSVTDAR